MMKHYLCLLAIPLALAFSPPTPRAVQHNQNSVDLNGLWKVSGNQYDEGKEICIKQKEQSIEARFFFEGQGACPISGGRNLLIDGTVRDTVLKGKIHLCTVVEKLVTDCGLYGYYSSPFEGTAGQDSISLRFHVDYVDYEVSPLGKWIKCNLKPEGGTDTNVTLTREPCPQDVCSYQITDEEVQRAVFKALKEHNVHLDPAAQKLLEMRGIGVKRATEHKLGKPTEMGNKTGFVIWLKPAPIIVIGLVSHTSCTSTDGTGLAVQLMVWQVRLENGEVKSFYGTVQDVTNKGSFNQKGLDQAMKAGFDQTNLNQYKTPPPPS